MRKGLQLFALMLVAFVLFGCSATFTAYRDNMFQGINMLKRGKYAEARNDFVKASEAQPDAYSYAFAATAAYKMRDLKSAGQFIQQAERLDGRGFAYLRIAAYKALILFAEGRQEEGLNALRIYLDAYKNLFPLTTIQDVEDMLSTGRIRLPLLEVLLDGQVGTYEDEIGQFYSTGTGWYANRYYNNAGGGFTR